jgi:hypothetical protein
MATGVMATSGHSLPKRLAAAQTTLLRTAGQHWRRSGEEMTAHLLLPQLLLVLALLQPGTCHL